MAAGISAGALLCFGKEMLKAEASSYSVNSVPTTIDCNDLDDTAIRNYYNGLVGKGDSQLSGTNLLKNLKPILKNGQTYYSYGTGATTAVWQAYEIVDRDWKKSPATSISGYNASTKIITGYTYGSSVNGSHGTNPYIHALYVNRNVENQTTAWDDHDQDQWGINQEHVWAKSCGFESKTPAAGARGDLMHLWAGNGKVNGSYHSNYYYGYVDTSRSYNDASEYASTLSGNKKGFSKTLGGTYNVFEPQDADKGDIARALFYMVARYNYLSGSDSDGIDAGNPNLEIVNELNWAPGSSYTSSTSTKGQMGILQDLLEWNRLDPPDEWEIHRNNLCYNNFTHNRNPFIDFPEWAEYIWGKSVDGSYNSASTGHADPNSDLINKFQGSTPVEKTLSSITISGQKTSFNVGDTFSFGGTVTAHYSDSTTANVTASSTFSGYNMSTAGNYTVIVSYTESAVTKTTSYQIAVSQSSTPGDVQTETLTVGTNGNTTWTNSQKTASASTGNVTYTALGSGENDGKYYSSDNSWRFYTSNQAGVRISVPSGYEIASVVLTWKTGQPNTPSGTTASGASSPTTYTVSGSGVTSLDFTRNSANFLLQKSVVNYRSTGNTPEPEINSISASVNKTYHVGDRITKSDITVVDNNDNEITDFSFADNNHQFTYQEAASGGALTNKTFTNSITYETLSCSLTVEVQRDAYEEPDNEDCSLTSTNQDFSAVTATTESAASDYTFNKDGVTYSTTCSYRYNGSNVLSFSDYSKDGKYASDGVFSNVTKMPTNIISASFTFNGSYTPNPGPTVEYSSDKEHWSTTPGLDSYYFQISFKEVFSGYINIKSVNIIVAGEETASSLANFIMYEDTEGQCTTKTDSAISIFNNMTTSERSTFMTSDDYVISTAKDRLDKWLINQGKEISISNGDYFVTTKNSVTSYTQENNHIYLIIAISGVISISVLAFYFLLKKKKSSYEELI